MIIIQLVCGYLQWYFFGKYEITSADIEQIMNEDGVVHIHEIITYRMRKPFRGVYRYIQPSKPVKIENVNLWIENIPNEKIEFQKNNDREFEAKIWVYNTSISPDKVDTIILHVEYDAKYIFENGQNIASI